MIYSMKQLLLYRIKWNAYLLSQHRSVYISILWKCCVYFRSRDVAELRAEMTFDPSKINLQQTCQVHGKTTVCVKTRVCFQYRIKSEKDANTGTGKWRACILTAFKLVLKEKDNIMSFTVDFRLSFSSVIRYSLMLDSLRAISRARFNKTEDRRLQKNESIDDRFCREHTFYTSASKSVFSYTRFKQYCSCTYNAIVCSFCYDATVLF